MRIMPPIYSLKASFLVAKKALLATSVGSGFQDCKLSFTGRMENMIKRFHWEFVAMD